MPTPITRAAHVLAQHRTLIGFSTIAAGCTCGWTCPPASTRDDADTQHLLHQGQALADDGLLPTLTRWGVRLTDHRGAVHVTEQSEERLALTNQAIHELWFADGHPPWTALWAASEVVTSTYTPWAPPRA